MPLYKYRIEDSNGNNVQVTAPSALKASKLFRRIFRGNTKVVKIEQLEAVESPKPKNQIKGIHRERPVDPIKATSTPGPNEPCSCGSGRKYKRCCMRRR